MKNSHFSFALSCLAFGAIGWNAEPLTLSSLGSGTRFGAAATALEDCNEQCACLLKATTLSVTLPDCVDLIDLNFQNLVNGCCHDEPAECVAANCQAKVVVEMRAAPGQLCRGRIESSSGAAAVGVISNPPGVPLSLEDTFDGECGEYKTYKLFTGTPPVQFAEYKVECENCF